MSDLEKRLSSKEAFLQEFEKMRPDLYYADTWSETDRNRAVEELRPSKVKSGMLSAIPMRCRGSDCTFAPSCPLEKKGLAPVGELCPIELSATRQFFLDYVDELGVDVDRMVEVSLVRDLVDQEIQQMRKTWLLSQEHFIQENVVGIDDHGKVIVQKNLHQAVDYEDRILKRKEKLRNALLATRESKAKTNQAPLDNAQQISHVLESVRKLQRQQKEELQRQSGMEEHDSYIEAEILEEEDD